MRSATTIRSRIVRGGLLLVLTATLGCPVPQVVKDTSDASLEAHGVLEQSVRGSTGAGHDLVLGLEKALREQRILCARLDRDRRQHFLDGLKHRIDGIGWEVLAHFDAEVEKLGLEAALEESFDRRMNELTQNELDERDELRKKSEEFPSDPLLMRAYLEQRELVQGLLKRVFRDRAEIVSEFHRAVALAREELRKEVEERQTEMRAELDALRSEVPPFGGLPGGEDAGASPAESETITEWNEFVAQTKARQDALLLAQRQGLEALNQYAHRKSAVRVILGAAVDAAKKDVVPQLPKLAEGLTKRLPFGTLEASTLEGLLDRAGESLISTADSQAAGVAESLSKSITSTLSGFIKSS